MKRKVPAVTFKPLFKQKLAFLHIPKTGGTALKNALIGHDAGITVFRNHSRTLMNCVQPVCFVLRDPLERFCSGYWERWHNDSREAQAREPANRPYVREGYSQLTDFEQQLYSEASTPDELITLFRTKPDVISQLAQSGSPLEMLTRSLTFWLGSLPQYCERESQVHTVIDMNCLTEAVRTLWDVDLSAQTDFASRRGTAFGTNIDNTISDSNCVWFKTEFRAQDYDLVNHIKSKPYFYTT